MTSPAPLPSARGKGGAGLRRHLRAVKTADHRIAAVVKLQGNHPDEEARDVADEVDAGKTTRSFNLDEPRDCRGANLIELVDMLFPDNEPKELGDAAANLDQSGRLVVAGYDSRKVSLDERAERSGRSKDQVGAANRVGLLGVAELRELIWCANRTVDGCMRGDGAIRITGHLDPSLLRSAGMLKSADQVPWNRIALLRREEAGESV